MSQAADGFDITLIDAFLRDRLDEDASESFELRMLGDADFALVVAQRRAVLDAVDGLAARSIREAEASAPQRGIDLSDHERGGIAAALVAWFTGPAWSGVATAGFALCAVLVLLEPTSAPSQTNVSSSGARTLEHEIVLHSLRSTSSASVPATKPFLLVVEAIDAPGAVTARLDGPEVIEIAPIAVGDDGFVRIMVDRLVAGSYDLELRDGAGQMLVAYGFEVSSQD